MDPAITDALSTPIITHTLGAETTAKLIKMKILIVGLRGIGIETAKNLALQGAGAITVGPIIMSI